VKEEYLNALKEDHGVTLFIQNTLDENFGKGTYKVHFVPTTIFELAAINSFMEYIIKSPDQPIYGNNRSIFPTDDIRNGDFMNKVFRDRFADDILTGLRQYQGNPNADLLAMKTACEVYNQSVATFEMFLQTTSYLINNFKQEILQDANDNKGEWKNIISNLVKWYNENERLFDKEVEIKEKGVWGDRNTGKISYNIKQIGYVYSDMVDSLVKGTVLDCESERKNNFTLWRGTGGLVVGEAAGFVDVQSIIDSPYLESKADYAEALKDWPDSLRKDFLSLKMTRLPADPPNQHNSFTSLSLSYGNSLMAGTFYEAAKSGGARALDYLRQGHGYALALPIAEFFNDTAKPSLREKYLVSSLHPLVALFSKGEYFHSRSKISLFDPKKDYGHYRGIQVPSDLEGKIPGLDRAIHAGFIVTSEVDWPILRSSISHDIAGHTVWIKEPWNASSWVETQKNFAHFSSLEVAAFKDHFLKFQPVLAQIKDAPPLKPVSERSATQSYSNERPKPLLGSKVQSLPMPETSPDKRTYRSNIFTEIINNPANRNTTPIIDTPHSMSFNDIRKRTKEHALIIPKGNYISFSHFIDFATPEEIVDLMHTVAKTADHLGISETGYRIITNNSLNPGTPQGNNANQEVPHFHIHLAGGECLGTPVVGFGKNMEISTPFGEGWTPEQFYEYANAHKIGEREIKTQNGKKRRLLAYRITGDSRGVTQLIGFLILDERRQSVYKSIHHFSEQASAEEMKDLFKFINDTTRHAGIDQSGFRLISSFGNDAGQYPRSVMNIIVAGGNPLGITVTNMYGNYRVWEGNGPVDYTDLREYPHEHCPPNAFDAIQFLIKIKKDVPEKLKNLEKEQQLNLSIGKGDIIEALQKVPDPKVVTKIDLSRRDIKELPEILQNFTSLEELDLDSNELELLPDWIVDLKKIKRLSIRENKLKTFPVEIEKLLMLEHLYLDNNNLESLPDSIGDLVNLEQFSVESNKLTALPDSMQNLTKLVGLYLSDNEIESLPNWINHLKNIADLGISYNKLKSLPDGICELLDLKELTLNNNELTTVPENIGALTKLEKLDLQNNAIISLPESIQKTKLAALRGLLDLKNNPDLLETAENGQLGREQLSEIFGRRFKF